MENLHLKQGLLPLKRAAKQAGVPVKWLREQAEAGKVPGLRAGNRWLFLPDLVNESIEQMAKSSSAIELKGGK